MNRKVNIILSLFIFFFGYQCKAQYNYIISSFDYSSNTTTYGRLNTLVRQPSYSPSISFFSKHAFDVTGMFYILDNSDSTFEKSTTEFDIMLGYEWEPFKNFTIYPSYSHFFYSKNSNSFKSGFSDNLQLDIDYELKFYNTGISGNYLFGDENTGLLSFRNSILLEKDNFLFDDFYVALQPGVDLTWGKQSYYRNSTLDYLNDNPDKIRTFIRNEREKNEDLRRLINLFIFQGMSEEEIASYLVLKYYTLEEEFNLNAITLNLPAFFMIGSHFSFMVNLMYYKPINTPDYIENDWKFFWSTGISYSFIL